MTKEIQQAICKMEVLKFNIPCENVNYMFGSWEYDVLSLNKAGNITEFEVKISRSDFKADRKKRKFKYYEQKNFTLMPNRFYYACPEGLIQPDEIPAYAGLIYFNCGEFAIIKNAPLIHKIKHDTDKIKSKILRIQTERMYLGGCRMTYNNKL